MEEDHPEWHVFDTIKGSDYLADQDAVQVLCDEAVGMVYELEHMGLPFDRTPDGRIAQRPFGGHTNNATKQPVRRACHAADRTGHMILQTVYQQCIKNNVTFFDEFQVVDLLVNDQGQTAGVVALHIDSGELHTFHAKATVFATGGFGRIWKITSNAYAMTGDGVAVAYRRGLPLEDMEFYQFHPTGILNLGILLTEGVRGEGGVLINGAGRAVHAEVHADGQGSGVARCGFALHLPGNPGGARHRRQGLRLPGRAARDGQQVFRAGWRKEPRRHPAAYHRGGHPPQAARHLGFLQDLPAGRPDQAADADPAHGALRDGRHSHGHQCPGGGRSAEFAHAGLLRRR